MSLNCSFFYLSSTAGYCAADDGKPIPETDKTWTITYFADIPSLEVEKAKDKLDCTSLEGTDLMMQSDCRGHYTTKTG